MAHETILVVDDEQDILELLTYNLEREGYKVIAVGSGEAAAAAADKSDLVVLDLMLPGIDGIELCKRLKSREDTAEIPIIMLTAKSEDSDVITGLEVGGDDYVTKPFSPKVLIARIRRLLRRGGDEADGEDRQIVRIHGIRIDISQHEVWIDDRQ